MAKKRKKVSLNDPRYQAAFNQAKSQAAAGRAQRAQNAKNIRKQGWQMAKEGLYDGIVQNSIDVVDGALSGALKAFGPGDKKTMIKGAIEGIADAHPGKKALNALAQTVKGVGKGIFNDLSWYNNYPDSTTEMIGPNFNSRAGIYEDLLDLNNDSNKKIGVPTFAMVRVHLTRGDDTDFTVSAAINRLYTSIRQANSGSVNWNPYQLDAYIYNWRLIIACYSMAVRALKYLNKYSVTDKNVPYALFSALGLDYDNCANNAASVRNKLEAIRVRLMGYAIPCLDILKRTYWLCSNGFWDSDDIKHQTYFIVPELDKFYSMASNSLVTTGLSSFPDSISSTADGSDLTKLVNILDIVTQEFMTNDVYSIISGDIVKAYGVGSLFVLDRVPTSEEQPVEGYSEEVLQQIQNAYMPKTNGSSGFTHTLTHAGTNDVGLTEALSYTESIYQNIPALMDNTSFINMYKNNITNLDVLGATRLVAFIDRNTSTFTVVTYGTEIFRSINYIVYNYSSANTNKHKLSTSDVYSINNYTLSSQQNLESYGVSIICWSTFDWSPRVTDLIGFFPYNSTTPTTATGAVHFDLNNYAKITTVQQLRDIHNVAVQSLYYTPLLSKIQSNVLEYGR